MVGDAKVRSMLTIVLPSFPRVVPPRCACLDTRCAVGEGRYGVQEHLTPSLSHSACLDTRCGRREVWGIGAPDTFHLTPCVFGHKVWEKGGMGYKST